MMQQIISKFPDDNPITAICVLEDISTPPPGYIVVSKTHDQDSDADLWRGFSLFGGRMSRYLCISKEENIADYIVENIGVIGEKDLPPDGYCLIPKTMDTDAKAWKKKQLCYSLTRRNKAVSAVTDVIILSKYRKAPEGFKLAGDINGFTVCYKVNTDFSSKQVAPAPAPILGYNLNPNGVQFPELKKTNGVYPNINQKPKSPGNDDYVNLLMPKRKAPAPPPPTSPISPGPSRPPRTSGPSLRAAPNPSNYSTLGGHQGLEGVPFVIHPNLQNRKTPPLQKMQFKTKQKIEQEYNYDFKLERQCT